MRTGKSGDQSWSDAAGQVAKRLDAWGKKNVGRLN